MKEIIVTAQPQERGEETFHKLREAMEATREYLENHDWRFCTCHSCGSGYYEKAKTPAGLCNSFTCAEGYKFLDIPRRRQNVPIDQVAETLRSVFEEEGFHSAQPLNIRNSRVGSTVFIGNAGQIFDRQIFQEERIDPTPVLVFQPAIRLQGRDKIGKIDGFTTSFVNTATEQIEANSSQHVKSLDAWMKFLSEVGLYLGNFTLKPKLEQTTWGNTKGIETYTLKFNYAGLELGVSNYTIIPQSSRPEIFQSDTTFGLERICWALNKNTRFYEIIGPLPNALRNEDVLMDAYRTTTLMAASGVRPGTDEQGSKLRRLAQRYNMPYRDFNPDLVRYYYNWWSRFTKLPLKAEGTISMLRAEASRLLETQYQQVLQGNIKVFGVVQGGGLSSRHIDNIRNSLYN